jgi:hypothetical protein
VPNLSSKTFQRITSYFNSCRNFQFILKSSFWPFEKLDCPELEDGVILSARQTGYVGQGGMFVDAEFNAGCNAQDFVNHIVRFCLSSMALSLSS